MEKKVRCRFTCDSVTRLSPNHKGEPLFTVEFSASSRDSKFFEYTPYGKLHFGTINERAATQFEPGCDYYVDLIKVEEESDGS